MEALLFRSRRIALLLSCNRKLSNMEYPCASKKYLVQRIAGMKSSAPTSSVSVELHVFSFSFVEETIGKPLFNDKPPPECLLILAKRARHDTCTSVSFLTPRVSTHHLSIPLPSALSMSGILRVPLRYFIRCASFFQSSVFGSSHARCEGKRQNRKYQIWHVL
jgi:hypothetical protein